MYRQLSSNSTVQLAAIAVTVLSLGTVSLADASTQIQEEVVILKRDSLTVLLAQNPASLKGVKDSDFSVRSDSQSRNGIEDLGQINSDYARSVALRAMLIDANEDRILDLLEQLDDLPNPSRRLATLVEIYRRYASVDPLRALTHASKLIWNHRLAAVRAIFREWSISDFDGAEQHATALSGSERRIALEAILSTRSDWAPEQTLEVATKWGYKQLGLKLLEQSYLSLAVTDPQAAWHALTTDHRDDDEQIQFLAEVLERWCLSEGAEVILSVEDSISSMNSGSGVLNDALRNLAERDPRTTFDLVQNLQSHLRDDALNHVVSAWAENDPLEALQAVFALEQGIQRNLLIRRVVSEWASEKPHELLQNLAKLPHDVHREAREDALARIVEDSPQEAVELMLEMPNGIEDFGSEVVSRWSFGDVRAALEWVLELGESHRQELFFWLIHHLVQEDQELAFETALSLPIHEYWDGHEALVVEKTAELDVEEAISMLARVRDHDSTKQLAYSSVARVLIRRNEAVSAIELGRELSSPVREDYYLNLFGDWANWDRVGLFETLDELPSADLRTIAANELLSHWFIFDDTPHRYFSEQQIEKIKAHSSNE